MTQSNPFQMAPGNIKEITITSLEGDTLTKIKTIIASDKVVLFMKGNTDFPQCGFSANTSAILKHLKTPFTTFNILSDSDIRQGLKEYSNWPTFPQLYIQGKLIGGNDIVTEMFEEGELQALLE